MNAVKGLISAAVVIGVTSHILKQTKKLGDKKKINFRKI